jgi:hypothetical protein
VTVDKDTLRAKTLEVAERLEQDAPAVTMTDQRMIAVTEQCAPTDEDEALNAALLARLPGILSGETQADYARAVREAVER